MAGVLPLITDCTVNADVVMVRPIIAYHQSKTEKWSSCIER
jgi:hypothetical protein